MLHVSVVPKLDKRPAADLVVWPFNWAKAGASTALSEVGSLQPWAASPLALRDFKGKEGDLLFLYIKDQPEKRLLLLGLGAKESVTTETSRRAYAMLASACRQRQIRSVNLLIPEVPALSQEQVWRGMVEGLLLANYSFDKLKKESLREKPTLLLQKAALVGANKT